ncbi:MAG TPA: hypothetical protein DCO77_10665 [Nitrospiraceae bacterium]|nr:hypothetical protein [Nitrospiraceae bacterium]
MKKEKSGKVRRLFVLAGVLLSALFLSTGAEAATHYVPDDYGTIQAAVNAAAVGDTVLVRPGTYHEHVAINDKTITLKSTDGPSATIIDGSNTGRPVTYWGEPSNGILDGFTITNGKASSGGGVYVYKGDPAIKNCIIKNNTASYAGGGIYLTSGACWVYVDDSVITGNHAGYYGGGIYSTVSCAMPHNTEISGNTAGMYGGGIATIGFCSTSLNYDTVISYNSAASKGGGLYSSGSSGCNSAVRTFNNLVVHNSSETGGGVYINTNAFGLLDSTTVAFNKAATGGGFYSLSDYGHYWLVNTIVYHNSSLAVLPVQCAWGQCTILHSDIEGGLGTGYYGDGTNISEDPLFVDPANGDYSLSPDSACIDAGVSSYHGNTAPDHDIFGNPRPQGDAHDIGAYEYSGITVEAAVNIDPDTLNLCGKGQWITAYISLPDDYSVGAITIPSVFLDDAIPAVKADIQGGDLMVKFDRESVVKYLEDRDGDVELVVSGMIQPDRFEGSDRIRVKSPGCSGKK